MLRSITHNEQEILGLQNLLPELLLQIFDYTPAQALLNLLCVSHYFNNTLRQLDSIWQNKTKREFLHFRTSDYGSAWYRCNNKYEEYNKHFHAYYSQKSTLLEIKFSLAVANSDIETIKSMIDIAGSEENIDALINHKRNVDGCTPLMLAVANNQEDIVSYLLSHHPSLYTVNKFRNTAFTYACINHARNIATILLDHYENGLDIFDENKWTPLHNAAFYGAAEIVRLLLERGASVDIRTDDIWTQNTALMFACQGGHEQAVEILLNNNASTHITNNGFNHGDGTALHVATYYGHLNIVKLLVDHGANVNDQGNSNQIAPLQLAMPHPDIFNYLLSKGANIDAVNGLGQTIQEIAKEYYPEIHEIISTKNIRKKLR